MIGALLLGLVLLAALWLLLRWYINAELRQVVRMLGVFALIVVVAVAVALILTGKFYYVLMAAPALLVTALRFRRAAVTAKNFSRAWSSMSGGAGGKAGAGTGGASRVTARFLDMTLDHATGALDGTVIEGEHKGARLSDLDAPVLTALLARWAREDAESARLLQAYMDRAHEGWRQEDGGQSSDSGAAPGAPGAMSREEAHAVLGLKPGAKKDEIRAAHRRLISKLHPDLGGADYLAAKINQAKDVLLG